VNNRHLGARSTVQCPRADRPTARRRRASRGGGWDAPVHGVHTINSGVSIEAVATAHVVDRQLQAGHDVRYLRYWVDEQGGKVFYLVEAPSAAAAATVHRQTHDLVPARSTR
jgi:hypothetical protein